MSSYRNKFVHWIFPVFNTLLITAPLALGTTFGISLVTDHQAVNLGSDWNSWLSFKTLLVNWLMQFAGGFYFYIQKNPLPTPDLEP